MAKPVSTVLEMTEIQTRLLATGGPAVLFERPILANGQPSPMPALANLFGTVKRVAMGVTLQGKSRRLGPPPRGGSNCALRSSSGFKVRDVGSVRQEMQ